MLGEHFWSKMFLCRWCQCVAGPSSLWSLFLCWIPIMSGDTDLCRCQRRVLSHKATQEVLCLWGHSRNCTWHLWQCCPMASRPPWDLISWGSRRERQEEITPVPSILSLLSIMVSVLPLSASLWALSMTQRNSSERAPGYYHWDGSWWVTLSCGNKLCLLALRKSGSQSGCPSLLSFKTEFSELNSTDLTVLFPFVAIISLYNWTFNNFPSRALELVQSEYLLYFLLQLLSRVPHQLIWIEGTTMKNECSWSETLLWFFCTIFLNRTFCFQR